MEWWTNDMVHHENGIISPTWAKSVYILENKRLKREKEKKIKIKTSRVREYSRILVWFVQLEEREIWQNLMGQIAKIITFFFNEHYILLL